MEIANPDFSVRFGTEENGESGPDTAPKSPEFTAERDEGFRYQRLHQAWGYACSTAGTMSHRYQRLWAGAIVGLEDSKGTLHVTWRDRESHLAFEGVILGAWEAMGEHAHHHHLVQR